ncbi:WXG100 family type VII secretion target [uncultured Streptomyces sp.]|uniref:WXG100 family type VII secretion target n=1 Tax=uncultured Streptomyces sp. TaxID=174707 RepID=UPI002625E3E9|nr:WXG100 family type VII secretion target [uncultured Streptomyces sp.]
MSDETQPEMTPAEQHAYDQGRVRTQLVVTDFTERAREVMGGFFGSFQPAGRTSFEGHDLNSMIDLVENSDPADLESAGRALYRARDAIKEAATELEGNLAAVEWKGEANTAFRDYGAGLVAHATRLSDFADAAATQITVAGTGLASVRNSLPPRDDRLVRKDVEDIPVVARVEGNAEYTAAQRVEAHRQEAINQANRLASYYAVSEQALAAQEPPTFGQKLDVAMPRPTGDGDSWNAPEGSGGSDQTLARGRGADEHAVRGTINEGTTTGAARVGPDALGVVRPSPDSSTGTVIDSVATPTAPTATGPALPTAPTATGGPTTGTTAPLPPVGAFGNPGRGNGASSRATGTTAPARGVGRSGAGGTSASATGRAGGVTGGTGGTSSPVGRAAGGTGASAAGRSGVTGGRPVAGHAGAGTGSAPRAGRSGIVGGTPQRPTASGAGTAGARGTVVGAPGAGQGRAPGSPAGQRGVVGNAAAPAKQAGRGTPGTNGVVGNPRPGSGGRPGGKGFTAGGAGLVRGPAGRRENDDEEENETSARPDYLTEDEETWTAGRRGAVPPVIE